MNAVCNNAKKPSVSISGTPGFILLLRYGSIYVIEKLSNNMFSTIYNIDALCKSIK